MKKYWLLIPLVGLFAWLLLSRAPLPEYEGTNSALSRDLALSKEEQNAKQLLAVAAHEPANEQAPEVDLKLPKLDHAELFKKAHKLEAEGRHLFAVGREVKVAPHLAGNWELTGDRAVWSFSLESEGATSINLAFSQFWLPDGGELIISDPTGAAGELRFTSADQDAHGELWTPILETDRLVVRLDLPKATAQKVRLNLSRVNHGFRSKNRLKSIGDALSGSCNIDVVCSASDDPSFGPLIDMYRDQIRSVAAYTIDGVEACSGALINNARKDLRPFFLTANHCEITSSNAASIVVYWNFENTTCRQPNTASSGQDGDGRIDQFNSGSILRAKRSESDFCLIELDDPVDPAYDPFYAGWDRTGANPTFAIGIHHPGVSEKRISFEIDPTTTTSYGSSSSNPSGTHIRVADWDYGTTEGGSSGSPLFNAEGRIVGQLEGGSAACGNNLSDWYGRLSRSWSDGGTPSTQLSSWLDPDNTGITVLDGINWDQLITIGNISITEGDSGMTSGQVTLFLSEMTTETVTVQVASSPDSATQDDFLAINQMVTFPPNTLTQTLTVEVVGDLSPEEHEQFLLVLSQPSNALASGQPGRVTVLNDDFVTPSIHSPLNATAFVNELFEYQITAANTPDTFSISNQPAGMNVDPVTGIISWIPLSTGPVSIIITASNSAGSDSETLNITVNDNPLSEAIDLTTPVSLTSDAPNWFRQTATTFDGSDAAESADILDDESSTLSLALTGPERLSFQWKVSSEEDFDQLQFLLDGELVPEVLPLSGEVDWVEVQYEVPPGTHTLSWRYSKDNSISDGEDAGWLDDVRLGSGTRPIVWSPGSATGATSVPIEIPLEFINATNYSIKNLPGWLTYDSSTNLVHGIPNTKGNFEFEAVAIGALESHTRNISVSVVDLVPNLAPTLGQANLITGSSGEQNWRNNSSFTPTAVISGDISDDESSTMFIWVQGPGILTFDWSVSSEDDYDFLSYSLNGIEQEEISGNVSWTAISVSLSPGINVLSWTYSKDGSLSEGDDEGLVRNIRLDGYAGFLNLNDIDHYSSSPTDDDDNNGRSLLFEYAFQVTPGAQEIMNPLSFNEHPTDPILANFQFDGLGIDADVEYYLEASDSLKDPDWQALPDNFQTRPNGNGLTTYTYETAVPANNRPKRFYRAGAKFRD